MAVNVCPPGVWSYYAYDPMRVMTYVALALFFVIFVAQLALTIKYRTRYVRPRSDLLSPASSLSLLRLTRS